MHIKAIYAKKYNNVKEFWSKLEDAEVGMLGEEDVYEGK